MKIRQTINYIVSYPIMLAIGFWICFILSFSNGYGLADFENDYPQTNTLQETKK